MQIDHLTKAIQALYLSFKNEFITLEGFARYHGFTVEQAQAVIDTGRKLHEEIVIWEKNHANEI